VVGLAGETGGVETVVGAVCGGGEEALVGSALAASARRPECVRR
jgi:hypothetical protein